MKDRVHLPDPDLPTIPTFSCAFMVNPIPRRASGKFFLYFILYLENFISPFWGHSFGGFVALIVPGASAGVSCKEKEKLSRGPSWSTLAMLNSLSPGKFFMLFCHLLIFFKIIFLEKLFYEYHDS